MVEPQTNADRIREMSDDKLAKFLNKVHEFPCEVCCGNLNRCRRNNAAEPVCERHFLEWLKAKAN